MRLLLCALLAVGSVYGQVCAAAGDEFTFVFVMDAHCVNSPANCASMGNWISTNKTACKIKMVSMVGDYVNAQSPGLQSEWDNFTAALFPAIQAMGLPRVYVRGNHDQGSGTDFFSATLANAYAWNSCYPDCAHPYNQYIKFDVSTSIGTLKFGVLAMDHLLDPCVSAGVPGTGCTGPSANSFYASAQPGTWAKGIMDAVEPNRQIFYTTHMMISGGSSGSPAGRWCEASGIGICDGTGAGGSLGFGLQQWQNLVQNYGQFKWTINGHDAYYPTSLLSTALDGHAVYSFGEKGASGDTGDCAFVMKFRPATHDIAVWFVDWTGAPNFRSFASTTWPWTPKPLPPSTIVLGPATIRGGIVH